MSDDSKKDPTIDKKEGFSEKIGVILKNKALKFIAMGKEWVRVAITYIKNHRKILIKIGLSIVVVIATYTSVFFLTTKPFYYGDRLNDGKIIVERMKVSSFDSESELQAYVRQYLIGNANYQIKLPYNSAGRIMGIYHDTSTENLVINWNPEFYVSWEEGLNMEDTLLFFYSIKKNFPVKTIRYLIDGRSIPITWEEQRLDEGINLDTVAIQKK
ncbi:MAG: hypothetical protein ACRCY4_05055 [Brevinema sp.]